MTANEIENLPFASELSDAKRDEAILVITTRILEYMDVTSEFNYEDKETLIKLAKAEPSKFNFYADGCLMSVILLVN
ncbi:hypothetical protein [Enterococcus hirae]|uniref:hypothetical protein n=1 Tax=Enterococcus hirae TaxID=1354 RepID=UPI001A96BE2E|nr:hypothetical protein [Enterococcus hirae]MBO1089969.1 hypothetical protein [Enterococcus hirae]MCC9082638.1 hypothetical protein [Enterococcus faecium]